jgi:diaminohydroxyphosphoribosylaminopyrimidine deaminase / 5-amino-6-(5-phosphoribosylamino)uracil reductase
MDRSDDFKFMKRCLELASIAEGMTYPNPMVGSVIVCNDMIIGEGFHLKAGLPHAEVNAVNSVRNKEKLRESTLYVNLEPCSHFGKTPPCADFIINNSIPRVIIGTIDTSRKVHGAGMKKLREAGIAVETGVLETESRWLNRRFFTYHEKNRPWIILKWAKSSDGFMDIERVPGLASRPTWISGKPERVLVHKWRSFEQAVLVGAETVRADNPKLNVREWKGNDPLPVILSSSGNIDPGSIERKKIVFTHNPALKLPEAEIVELKSDEPSCKQVAAFLYNTGIQSLFVEGGAQLLNHFIANDLWDEARIFTGKKEFGHGVKTPLLKGTLTGEEEFEGSMLQIFLNESLKGMNIKIKF